MSGHLKSCGFVFPFTYTKLLQSNQCQNCSQNVKFLKLVQMSEKEIVILNLVKLKNFL